MPTGHNFRTGEDAVPALAEKGAAATDERLVSAAHLALDHLDRGEPEAAKRVLALLLEGIPMSDDAITAIVRAVAAPPAQPAPTGLREAAQAVVDAWMRPNATYEGHFHAMARDVDALRAALD